MELPEGEIFIEPKDVIDPAAMSNLANPAAAEKRSKEELMESCGNQRDVGFMYKVVGNHAILKFPVTVRKGYNVEKDELKFGFNLQLESKISSTQNLKVTVPVVLNTGILKINNSGGNISSAQSVVSVRAKDPAVQEAKLKQGKAQMLDTSFVTSATEKQKLDESFQSAGTQ